MSRRRLPLEQALLGFLMQRPLHGYDLHERVEKELGEIWYMGISNVYGALKRLEQSGQIESDLIPQEEAGKYLGLSNLATAGSGAASRLAGPLIDGLNALRPGAYLGYPALFILASVSTLAGTLLMLRIRRR